MKYRFTILLVALSLIPTLTYAQKKKAASQTLPIQRFEDGNEISVEFDTKESEGGYRTLSLGSDGLVVYYDTKDGKKNVNTYEFVKFDKDLNQEYTINYTLPEKVQIIQIVENLGKVYFLTAKASKSLVAGSFLEKYTLVRFDPMEKKFTTYDGDFPVGGAYLKEIKVVNDIAYMSLAKGYSPTTISLMTCLNMCTCMLPTIFGITKPYKSNSELIVHNMQTKAKKLSQFGYDKKKGGVYTLSMSVDDSTGVATLLLAAKATKNLQVWTKDVESTGKAGKDITLKLPPDKIINDVKLTTIDDKKYFFGQYIPVKKQVTIGLGGLSAGNGVAGVFFGVAGDKGLEKTIFTPYSKIKGFKAPLSSQEARMLKKGAKKGNSDVGINLMVHFGAPLIYNDEIITIGEVYYATYRTEVTTTYQNGRAVTTTRQVFDGYAFSNILVLAYNTKGELVWNNSIPYTRSKSFVIRDRVKANLEEDGSVRIVYNNGFTIFSTLIDGDKVVEGKKVSIGGNKKGDKVKYTLGDGNVEYWYDDYYTATGIQEIKNKQLKGKDKKRNVFYIRRVEVTND